MPFDRFKSRLETDEMIIQALNKGVPLPPTENQDRAEQSVRQNATATVTAATVEFKTDVEPDLEIIRRFQPLNYRVSTVIAEVMRLSKEEEDDFSEKSEASFEEMRVSLNEIQVITTAGGVNPKTIELRQQAVKKSVMSGIGDGVLSTGIIASSGALEGGILNAANYGLITPITAVLLGYVAGDWLYPQAKQIREKPLIGSLAWAGIIGLATFVYVMVDHFANFRETLETVPAEYLSMALQAINMFAFFGTAVVWAKTPPSAPRLSLLKREIEELADEVADRFEIAVDEVKAVSETGFEKLEELTEELSEDVDDVETAFERVQDDYDIYVDDLGAAQTDHETWIDEHRSQIRETLDGSSVTLPAYIGQAADLRNTFTPGFDIKRYQTMAGNASSALASLDAAIETARKDIDKIRDDTLRALKAQRQKDPTL